MRVKESLAMQTMLKMGIRITLVVIATAVLSYLHILHNLEEQTLDKLRQYIVERAEKESHIFLLAEDNHKVFADAFLNLWPDRENISAQTRFDELFLFPGDGTVRLTEQAFYGVEREHSRASSYLGMSRHITGFVERGAPVQNNSYQNRLLLSYDLVDRFAEGWAHRFANTYTTTPEGSCIVYWPGLPWAFGADPALDLSKEEWVYIADKTHNPQRESAWTGLYYDQTANEWMVSCETPVDTPNGQHLITIGHDILLNSLFERVFNDHLEGAFNFIFRKDGRLIAHPHFVEPLRHAKGVLNIRDVQSTELNEYFSTLSKVQSEKGEGAHIIDITTETSDAFLAVSKIEGPEWFFVTVYPKELLSTPALHAAEFIFMIGAIGLFIEIMMLFLVVKKSILAPLSSFEQASQAVSDGRYHLRAIPELYLPSDRADEVGRVSRALLYMSDRIQDYHNNMEDKISERTLALEEAKRYAEAQARTDTLTGLPNRRAFFEVGEKTVEGSKRYAHSLTSIMIDIDEFKSINDTYGHATGDAVIKSLANIIQDTIRSSDLTSRLGGEEFAVLLYNTDSVGGFKLAERLRKKLEETTLQIGSHSIAYTASFGVAQFSMDDKDLDTLLSKADHALYKAKEGGRNKVVAA